MTTTALRASLLALAALSACGVSQPPAQIAAPPLNPPVDPELPLAPNMRCASVVELAIADNAADCGTSPKTPT